MNALCCCDDILLPSLIKYFVKLSEKYIFFYSQQIKREKDRKEMVFRGWPALSSLLPLVMTALLMKMVASLLLASTVEYPHWLLVHATGAASAGFRSW